MLTVPTLPDGAYATTLRADSTVTLVEHVEPNFTDTEPTEVGADEDDLRPSLGRTRGRRDPLHAGPVVEQRRGVAGLVPNGPTISMATSPDPPATGP